MTIAKNQSIVYDRKTKYIITEFYIGKIELKDAIINILHSRFNAEKNNKKAS
ncbi:MAG: hypothetical protein FWH03_00850 [Firmicutes bacterium]|nr:hypothetical protein [Bacillota bacterium]